MKKMIPLMNGDVRNAWVSGFLKSPLEGTTSTAMKITYARAVIPAQRMPRFSFSAISCTTSDASGT